MSLNHNTTNSYLKMAGIACVLLAAIGHAGGQEIIGCREHRLIAPAFLNPTNFDGVLTFADGTGELRLADATLTVGSGAMIDVSNGTLAIGDGRLASGGGDLVIANTQMLGGEVKLSGGELTLGGEVELGGNNTRTLNLTNPITGTVRVPDSQYRLPSWKKTARPWHVLAKRKKDAATGPLPSDFVAKLGLTARAEQELTHRIMLTTPMPVVFPGLGTLTYAPDSAGPTLPVPEPTTISLLMLGGASLIRRRRRA